jgi:hypothetical protein
LVEPRLRLSELDLELARVDALGFPRRRCGGRRSSSLPLQKLVRTAKPVPLRRDRRDSCERSFPPRAASRAATFWRRASSISVCVVVTPATNLVVAHVIAIVRPSTDALQVFRSHLVRNDQCVLGRGRQLCALVDV